MKDLGDASYVLGIETHQDRSKGVLGLSQRAYIDKVLKIYNMHNCSSMPEHIVKGDKFGLFKCPKNQLEIDQMKTIPYASTVRSIMYAQVCTQPDLAYVTGMLRSLESCQESHALFTKGLKATCLRIERLKTLRFGLLRH
jgi:hypothetical protein